MCEVRYGGKKREQRSLRRSQAVSYVADDFHVTYGGMFSLETIWKENVPLEQEGYGNVRKQSVTYGGVNVVYEIPTKVPQRRIFSREIRESGRVHNSHGPGGKATCTRECAELSFRG